MCPLRLKITLHCDLGTKVTSQSASTPQPQRKSLFSGHKRLPQPSFAVGPVIERENGLSEKTERRKVERVQVKARGFRGLLSCAVFFSEPHPVTKGLDIFLIHSFHRPLFHICTGERTAVQHVWVGDLKVRFAGVAGGRSSPGEGWRSDGEAPVCLLSGETDGKQTSQWRENNGGVLSRKSLS